MARRGNLQSNRATRSGTKRGNFTISLEVNPSPWQLAKLYDDLANDLTDFRPAWGRISRIIGGHLGANVRSQGGAIGETYPKLSPPYSRRKDSGSRPLINTGAMVRALASGEIVSRGRSFLSVGLRGPEWGHAPALHFGFGRRRLPPRPIMTLSNAAQKDIAKAMGDHVNKVIADASKSLRGGA